MGKKSDTARGALVIAGGYTALGLVRSLGRRGIPVWVLGDRWSLAGVSRYAQRTLPFSLIEAEQVDALIRLATQSKTQGWTIFPDSDRSAAMLARHRTILQEYYRMTVPTWDVLQWAFDKRKTYALANELGIDHPKTFAIANRAELESLPANFPMILKPTHHQGRDGFSILSGAWRADNRAELMALYDKACALAGPSAITIQEMIPGGGEAQFSYAVLCQQGQVLVDAFAQRKRMLPIDFGSSTYVETIAPKPYELVAKQWLGKIQYTGLAEMDFKFDARDGQYKLLDVNARAWGWLAACNYAHVDYAYLMWQMANGMTVAPTRVKAGIRWIRTPYDCMSALQLIPRRTLSWGEYAQSLRGVHHEMYAWDDPFPVLVEMPLLFQLAWQRFFP